MASVSQYNRGGGGGNRSIVVCGGGGDHGGSTGWSKSGSLSEFRNDFCARSHEGIAFDGENFDPEIWNDGFLTQTQSLMTMGKKIRYEIPIGNHFLIILFNCFLRRSCQSMRTVFLPPAAGASLRHCLLFQVMVACCRWMARCAFAQRHSSCDILCCSCIILVATMDRL